MKTKPLLLTTLLTMLLISESLSNAFDADAQADNVFPVQNRQLSALDLALPKEEIRKTYVVNEGSFGHSVTPSEFDLYWTFLCDDAQL